MNLRLTAARLARFVLKTIVNRSSADTHEYLRHAGIAVEELSREAGPETATPSAFPASGS